MDSGTRGGSCGRRNSGSRIDKADSANSTREEGVEKRQGIEDFRAIKNKIKRRRKNKRQKKP